MRQGKIILLDDKLYLFIFFLKQNEVTQFYCYFFDRKRSGTIDDDNKGEINVEVQKEVRRVLTHSGVTD